jgi:hypothetical protein
VTRRAHETTQGPNLIYILGLCALILLPTLVTPFRFDNAVFQGIAFDLVHFGRTPFETSWLHDVPGLIYLHGLAILIFGDSDLSIRYLDLVLQLAFIAFLYHFLQRWLAPRASALSCVLYALFYLGGGVYMYFQRDVFIAMLTIIAWHHLLVFFDSGKMWRFVLSAIIIGITIFIRSTSIILLPTFGIYLWITLLPKKTIQSRTLISVSYIMLCLMPIAAWLVYYFQAGLIQNVYDATIRWNTDLYSGSSEPLSTLGREVGRVALLWLIPLYIRFSSNKLADIRRRLSASEYIFWSLLLLGSLTSILIQHKFFRYHVAPLFIFLIPVTSVGILTLIDKVRNPVKRQYALIALCWGCTLLFYVPRSPLAFGLALTQNRPPLAAAYDAEYTDPMDGAFREHQVLSYFDRPENRTGPIEVCSYDPLLRLHLRRECVGPYNVLDPIGWRLRTDSFGRPQFTAYQRIWQKQYVDLLQTKKPEWIVIDRKSEYYGLVDPYSSLLRYLPDFPTFFQAYKLDTAFGAFQIFRRNAIK